MLQHHTGGLLLTVPLPCPALACAALPSALRLQEEAASPRVTLRSLHERVLRRLEHWKGRRAERMLEFEAIMVRCTTWLQGQGGKGVSRASDTCLGVVGVV